ncbi:SDR family oxidoreductase [Mesoterricola sediminis]|uniref:Short chain dehydrogenase n=1 Tax=Mesoterricola sediminis TaxID=2927980 RepID=A0AA48GS54_9BACT|nr:NAD(P)-dependent oxidoreductase [Mesoterricola sediminis]BDU78266.1 short chain dehydrogenase [Mesoterricola sediminis]
MGLAGKTLFITGATRGIGLAIALRAAREGANVTVFGKTAAPHPRLPGTVASAAAEVEAAGGRALPWVGDVRSEEQVLAAVAATVATFGGLDILVNNASAISLAGTEGTDLKRWDLMHQVNARGTFLCAKACLPHLRKAANPHILTLSPPLDLRPKWFAPHVAYTLAKFGMSLCTLGMAEEFRPDGVAVNSLWPLTTIDTAAVRNLLGGDALSRASRRPEIVADAAALILDRDARACTGNFFIDELVLREAGVTDFSPYAVDPSAVLVADFFLPDAVLEASGTPLQVLG